MRKLLILALLLPNFAFGGDFVRTRTGFNYKATTFQYRSAPIGSGYIYQRGNYSGRIIGRNFVPSISGARYSPLYRR